MIDEIIKHLYISDANSVISQKGQDELKRLQISHILTVSAMAIPERSQIKGIEYKFLFAMDLITQDIFADNLLAEALQYIEEAINDNGNVLVHCEVGMSRSVFVVMAYLMRRYHWSVEKALTHIRNVRPIAYPNEGFLRQLSIFQILEYKADFDSLSHCAEYRNWCASSGNLFQMSQLPTTLAKNSSEGNASEFRCRKCRKTLFYDDHVLKHATQASGSEGHTTHFSGTMEDECGFGFLLTPMKWMDLSAYEGKILCPQCKEKLGHYVWGGRVCLGVDGKKCGTSVRPWVHIHKGKVDMKISVEASGIVVQGGFSSAKTPIVIQSPVEELVKGVDSFAALSMGDGGGSASGEIKIKSKDGAADESPGAGAKAAKIVIT